MKKTWRIKDAVLLILSAACLFLLMYAMGVFSFSAGGASESYTMHAKERAKHVQQSHTWNIYATPPQSAMGKSFLSGMKHAMQWINEEGGILGKQLNLITYTSAFNFAENKFVVQDICDNKEAAILYAPWYAAEVQSTRAVTQFHALPLVSVSLAENLPPLTPDLYLSLLPDLSTWATPLSRVLREQGYKRILVIAPEKPNYSGVLAEKLEETMRNSDAFEDIFRSDYAMPADAQTLHKLLKLYRDNMNLDAIVFMGDDEELPALAEVMQELDIKCPVYGSDELDTPNLALAGPEAFPGGLFYLETRGNIIAEKKLENILPEEEKEQLWVQYGFMSIMLMKEALEENESYMPESLVISMKDIWKKHLDKYKDELKVTVVPFGH